MILVMIIMIIIIIIMIIVMIIMIIYKYDIPVWCTTGITPPREECSPRA